MAHSDTGQHKTKSQQMPKNQAGESRRFLFRYEA